MTENYDVIEEATDKQEESGMLQIIYEDGEFFNQYSFQEVRDNIEKLLTEDNQELLEA